MTGIARNPALKNGFSLIEMLVVLAVLGMVAGLMAGGLGLASAAMDRLARVPPDDVTTAQQIVRERIERLAPGSLAGTDRTLTFTAPPLDRDAPGAMAQFRLLRTPAGDLALHTPASGRPTVLLTRIAGLQIAYDATGSGRGWRRSWTARETPRLVRLRVILPPGDSRIWPDLVAHPQAGN